MRLALKYGDTEGLDDIDESIVMYRSYIKINKGLTYEMFINEDAYVINSLLAIKAIEIEEEQKELKKANKRGK